MTGLEMAKVTKWVKSVIWSPISGFEGVVMGAKRGNLSFNGNDAQGCQFHCCEKRD